MDTIESSQTEKRGDLRYQIGSDEPFTGTAITTFGEGVDGHFIGVVRTYVNGKQVKYSYWDYVINRQIQETYVLKDGEWVQISLTSYSADGQKLQHSDYENEITTYWYANGGIKEETGKVNDIPYHKYWDRDGNEIIPEKSKSKTSAPLYKTAQNRFNTVGLAGYFIILFFTAGLFIFKLQNLNAPHPLKIVLVMVFSFLALIVALRLYNDIKFMSYDRFGIWGTLFGSLSAVLYLIPYSIQLAALLIVISGIRKK